MSRSESRYSVSLTRSLVVSPVTRRFVDSTYPVENAPILLDLPEAHGRVGAVGVPEKTFEYRRGRFSIATGVVGVRQQSVFMYAQLYPASQ